VSSRATSGARSRVTYAPDLKLLWRKGGNQLNLRLVPQVRPSVGLTRDRCARHPQGCRLHPFHAVCADFRNPDSRISSPSVVIAASPISSAPQFTTCSRVAWRTCVVASACASTDTWCRNTFHLLLSEPDQGTLAEAIHYLKLSFAKRLRGQRIGAPGSRVGAPGSRIGAPGSPLRWANLGSENPNPFWQKRYYDRNVRDAQEFAVKLRYLHRNPVKRGLVKEPGDWGWSSFRHYAFRENGEVEIESEWTAEIVS
jgi:REP element-mobilizing transposase RayT